MKLLKSEKFKLPVVYYITDRKEIRDLPIGVPFIVGDAKDEDYFVRILEYEILYQEALNSGLPFDFRQILKEAGYQGLQDLYYDLPAYMDIRTSEFDEDMSLDFELDSFKKISKSESSLFKTFVKDSAAYVDVQKLKNLNIFPVWLDKIEKAVETNVHNFAVFNNNMYNKKLDGMYGSLDLVSPDKNLIIIDISGSIPKAVSSTCLILSKNLAESFYADLLITGSKSTLYHYEDLYKLDIETIYDENGMDNDQVYFKKLVSSEERVYKTAIVFGDNHTPSHKWSNDFNVDAKEISREDGKKLCKWKIDKLISFHTEGIEHTAGYADWFTPNEVEKIKDWVKYLK